MRRWIATAAAWLIGAAALAADTAALLSQGKLDADLGKSEQAAAAFQAVADDTSAPAAQRAEALIRLGLVRGRMGDTQGANRAFERVWSEHRTDMETMRQLVHAVTGALPSGKYWDANWQGVVLVMDEAGPRVEWPGIAPGRRTFKGAAVSLHLKDGNIQEVFRLFADVSSLNVVVFPGVHGKVTYKAHEVPWDQALHAILAPNGLDYLWIDNVLTIAPPEHLGTARRGPDPQRAKTYTGAPVTIDFKDVDLRGGLAILAETGGDTVTFAPSVNGKITIKLHEVRWDQALDVVAQTHGIAWTPQGKILAVHQRKAGPGADQRPASLSRLNNVTADQARLRGIVKAGSRYVALFACPDGRTGSGTVGARLQDAEIKAIDAATVTFRRSDGTASRQSLYPAPAHQRAPGRGQLDAAPLDQVRLRGINRAGSRHIAILACPNEKVCFGSVGDRLQDAEIKAIDAATVTFRRSDGTENRLSLQPSR